MIYRLIVLWLILALIPLPVPAQKVLYTIEDKKSEKQTDESMLAEEEEDPELILPTEALEGPIDPETYVLGPSDRLMLIISGPERTTIPFKILPEGTVLLPNIGPFQASGMTLSEFTEHIRRELGRFYKNVTINCSLLRTRSFVVYVLGEVIKPGPVELRAPFRLSQALEGAGGVSGSGSQRQVEVHQDGQPVQYVDLQSFLKLGDFNGNPTLREGQSVVVPPRKKTVRVLGEVRLPGLYELKEGESAGDLLSICGGITAWGDKNRLIIERVLARDSVYTMSFSYDEIDDVRMRNRDVLVVSDILSFPQNRFAYVRGGGGRQGRFLIQPGETLRQFLPRTWRVAETYTVDTFLLERRSSGDEVEVIRFNPEDIFAGDPLGDIELEPGDIINVPPIIESVYVAGEVNEPGEYVYRAEFNAEEYISMAGGPNERGTFNRISIISREGKERGAAKDSVVKRGETIVVKRSYSSMAGSVLVTAGSLTAIVLSIVALQRAND